MNYIPCKPKANNYLTGRDIESANRKVKLKIVNSKISPGKNCKLSYITYTAQERTSIRQYSSQYGPRAASWYFTKKLIAQ